jgi:hypothetical protein
MRNAARALGWWLFYCGPILSIPGLLGYRALLDRRVRPLVIVTGVFAIGLSFEVSRMPHYAGPLTAAWMASRSNRRGMWPSTPLGGGRSAWSPSPSPSCCSFGRRVCCSPRPHSPGRSMPWRSATGAVCPGVASSARTSSGSSSTREVGTSSSSSSRIAGYGHSTGCTTIPTSMLPTRCGRERCPRRRDAALAAHYPDRRVWLVDATSAVPTLRRYVPRTSSGTVDTATGR